jgi:hypothetical protein
MRYPMSSDELSGTKQPRRDSFDDEAIRKMRLTPEEERCKMKTEPAGAKVALETGDSAWPTEVLPGEMPPRRDLFDDETHRRIRLTPEEWWHDSETRDALAKKYPRSFWLWPPVADVDSAKSRRQHKVSARHSSYPSPP